MMSTVWNKYFYRHWAKLLHRFSLHHTERIGPVEDGSILEKCNWCGISRWVYRPGWKRIS